MASSQRVVKIRWGVSLNEITLYEGEVAAVLLQISSQLFFLAAKSQEQVTDDYRAITASIRELAERLEAALKPSAPQPSSTKG